ncbi:hypothetical protein BYT27DRAFT_7222697 [Phlegmacium glaucopus]|nr:hypothetical protein BYT27DRAFT_7222697 [Phlegmacium glaucopus]
MPSTHCPQCGKKFKDQTSLLQHMNQLFSSCLTHFEECIDIATTLQSGPAISESDDTGQQSFELPGFMDTAEDYLPASSHSSLPASTSPNPGDRRNPFNIKNYPTSGQVFGRGETFMDQCDKDRYTEMRKGHLYYPFTSRDEWELASFLLHSCLSMAAVDCFLKLKLMKNIGLSFHTAKDLQNHPEMLLVGPSWKSKPWPTAFWEMQDFLPQGATLLGTVLLSDKTNISAMTNNLLHAFLLLALLPVPSFIHHKKCLYGLLGDRLVHECLDFVLQLLKTTASIGIMMSDPLGWTSSVTMASYKQLGDNFRHEPRTASTTLAQLHVAASQFHLNGIHRPFWVNWPMSDPSIFLTPEPLHHWHKAFWDHDAKWCINTVGATELDFCFSVLHQHVGFQQFKEGILSLKQVTGCEHREIQHYIVAVIADAVPPDFLIAIPSLMDFHYLAQSMQIDEPMCTNIDAAPKEFHTHKDLIIAAGAQQGKNHVIDNCVIPSIHANTDGTEHAHIEVIKDPSDFSNNQKFESQICQHLDHIEKSVHDAKVDFCTRFSTNGSSEEDNSNCASVASDGSTIETTANLVNQINPSLPSHVDYFAKAANLKKNPPSGQVPQAQPHTFSSPQAAFHLNCNPSLLLFNIPDLHEALSDYIQCIANANNGYIRVLGGRRSASQGSQLPFTHLQVWKKLHLQNIAYHFPHETLPSKTVNACPPSGEWELGRYNPVIINLDPDFEWPHSRLEGMDIIDFWFIDCFLTYARCFDIVPQINKNISANGELIGDILPLQRVRAPVDLTPCFGNVADRRLTKYNSSTCCSEFRLNKYFDKELYLSLS